jgi:hypothetical protein
MRAPILHKAETLATTRRGAFVVLHKSTPTAVRLSLLLCFALLSAGIVGCGYMVGSGYQGEIRSVYVPVFKSESYRRGVEFQLTEAVQREIKRRTPFRIAKESYADTRLTGRLVEFEKDVLTESRFDDPRELQMGLAVEVIWEDLRTAQILAQQRVPVDPETVHLYAQSEFAPEVGQSLATATQQAVDRMARKIVNMMEAPW